jgi:hypothetical protein
VVSIFFSLEGAAMASVRQVEANRQNGLKGGVKSEEGAGIEDELIASLRPVGRLEEMLVEKIALTYLRMQRCARAEAEFHIETWREPNRKQEMYQWEQLQKERRCGARGSTFRAL